MTDHQSALLELLDDLLAGDGGDVMRRLLQRGLQMLIEAEATAVIGAGRHERTEVSDVLCKQGGLEGRRSS